MSGRGRITVDALPNTSHELSQNVNCVLNGSYDSPVGVVNASIGSFWLEHSVLLALSE